MVCGLITVYSTDFFIVVQHWLLDQQPEYLWESDMVWVQHLDVIRGCAAFVYQQVRSVDCNLKLPFICESGECHEASCCC